MAPDAYGCALLLQWLHDARAAHLCTLSPPDALELVHRPVNLGADVACHAGACRRAFRTADCSSIGG